MVAIIAAFPFFLIGMFLLIGSIVKIRFLITPPNNWFIYFPYSYLSKFGNNAIRIYHIIIGFSLMVASIIFGIYVNNVLR